jgi:two-component system CheB/CheR fusion protein
MRAGASRRRPHPSSKHATAKSHELATNAAKYGALSTEEGSVAILWSTMPGNDHPSLKFVWREQNGPPVKVPEGSGFGSILIERGLPEATVKHEFLPEGVVCRIEVPLREASENGPQTKAHKDK